MRRLLLWYRMSASAMLGPEMVWRLFPPSQPISFHWYVWCASRSVPLSQWKAKWGLSGKGPAIVQEFAKKPENCFRNVFVFQCFKVCYGSFRLFQGLFKFDACFFSYLLPYLFISVFFRGWCLFHPACLLHWSWHKRGSELGHKKRCFNS